MEATYDHGSDKRGWILTLISGAACTLGACIILIDYIGIIIPRYKGFTIRDSSSFSAASLALSGGVMIFSALFGMMRESEEYLEKAGWGKTKINAVAVGSFMGGALLTYIIGAVLHRVLPSAMVHCESDEPHTEAHNESHGHPGELGHPHHAHNAEHHAQVHHNMNPNTSHNHEGHHVDHHGPVGKGLQFDQDAADLHHQVVHGTLDRKKNRRNTDHILKVPGSDSNHRQKSVAGISDAYSAALSRHQKLLGKRKTGLKNCQLSNGDGAADEPDETTTLLPVPAAAPPSRRPTAANFALLRRPSLASISSFLLYDKPAGCGQHGEKCLGFTVPCGDSCHGKLSRKGSNASLHHSDESIRHFSNVGFRGFNPRHSIRFTDPTRNASLYPPGIREEEPEPSPMGGVYGNDEWTRRGSYGFLPRDLEAQHDGTEDGPVPESPESDLPSNKDEGEAEPHHHHVPENEYLSISLQTTLAITLHKLPEGFITYTTNHASPELGFSIFLALFAHNISEGFALALPLYLALGKRWQAIIAASLLGGLTQPVGAFIAWLWLRSNDGIGGPTDAAYGIVLGVTGGIMAFVACQLYGQSILTHRSISFSTAFSFIGMGIIGFSFGLGHAH